MAEEAERSLEKQPGVGVKLGMTALEAVVGIYDVLTLPIYFVAQRPWRHWRRPVYVRRETPADPRGPYISTRPKCDNPVEGIATLDILFREAVRKFGSKLCLGYRRLLDVQEQLQPDGKVFKKFQLDDEYTWLSYEEADRRVEILSRSLLALGVRSRDHICILAETRLEWILLAQACFRINVAVVTLYPTLGEDGIVHGLNETRVTYLFTSNDLLPKVQNLISRTPSVRHVVVMEGPSPPDLSGPWPESVSTKSFTDFENMGHADAGAIASVPPQANDEAIIMYTSGSTGIPKGVVLLHSNIVATAGSLGEGLPKVRPGDIHIAFLPLAHILELSVECVYLWSGVRIGYSSPLTLTDNSTGILPGHKGDATLLKPTHMIAVPLVLDRIRKGITEKVAARGMFAKSFFNFAIKYKIKWYQKGFNTPLLDRILFRKIREGVGGRLKAMAAGGAALSADTHEFTRACLGLHLMQGYGLTETTGSATVMLYTDRYSGLVGPPLTSIKIRLEDWREGGYLATDLPNPRGEIVIGGPCVAKGYYKNDAMTQEFFRKDEKGEMWFATGDIGEIYPDGAVKIIDRKKDLVKLQFGEYVSLGKVEAELKSCPLVDNICVYGSGFHTYLVALVTPNPDKLRELGKTLGKEGLGFQELCHDRVITAAATRVLSQHGAKCKLLKTEIPAKIKLCTEEWIPDTGLVTASFKIRRRYIEQFYKKDIHALYGGGDENSMST